MKGQILLSGEGLGELSNSLERRNVGQEQAWVRSDRVRSQRWGAIPCCQICDCVTADYE